MRLDGGSIETPAPTKNVKGSPLKSNFLISSLYHDILIITIFFQVMVHMPMFYKGKILPALYLGRKAGSFFHTMLKSGLIYSAVP